jgi:PAS domain S-box-containing protein
LQHQEYVRYEHLLLQNKSGVTIHVEFISNFYFMNERKVIQCNIRDITERKRAEERTTQLAVIVQSSEDAIIGKSLDGIIMSWNKGAEKIYGYTESEVIGKSISLLISPGNEDEMSGILHRIRSGEVIEQYEIARRRKDGREIQMSLTISPIRDPEGKIVAASTIGRDITKRKRAEQELIIANKELVFQNEERKRADEELQESETRYRSVLQSATDAIVTAYSSGIIIGWNRGAERIFGYSYTEAVGQPLTSIIPLYRHDEHTNGMKGLQSEGDQDVIGKTVELEGLRKDKSVFPLELSLSTWEIKSEQFITGIIRDISERKRAEEKNRQLQQQLIQAQKLESLGTLASGIAHDFNNILGIILAYSSLLGKIKMGSEKYSESLNAITNAVQRGAALVRQILTFARKTDILFEPMSLLELVNEVLSMLNQTFPKTIIFRKNIEKDIPYISADRTQIYQALLNLCVNARDAMPNGGCITLTIEKRTGEQIREQFPTANQDSYLCTSVTDTGEGMDETTRSRIFDPFFTTKEKGKGTGLGLSVVFGVVQTHHGFIDVESEPGKGTTFRLYLPVSQTVEPIRVEEGQTITEEILGGTETLLVVEDEKALSELVRHLLETKGYKVHTAQDGNEAIEVYKRYKEEIDIVLTDMGLPGMVGAEVFKKLKEINPNVSVIFCSGSNEANIKSELYKAGAKGFIQKPYDTNELLRKLREVLDEK